MKRKSPENRHFDWQTDEDAWPAGEPALSSSAKHSRKPWIWLFSLLGLVVAMSAVLLWQRTQREVAAVAAAEEEEVLASHRWLQEVVARGDMELLPPLLSGRDYHWSAAQLRLADDGELFSRAPFALVALDPADAPLEGVTIAPDLQTAILTIQQPFRAAGGETVTLAQTAVYRRGETRWLYAPPPDTFWGPMVEDAGARVIVLYPQRDAAVSGRLALDMEQHLARLCADLRALECPQETPFSVRLDTDPDLLARMADFPTLVSSGMEIALPAPSLVGLPQDEPGYRLLRDGYLRALSTAVIGTLLDYDCCARAMLLEGMIGAQLRVWQLTPPPGSPAADLDYETVSRTLRGSWNRPYATLADADAEAAQYFADYLQYLNATVDFSPLMELLLDVETVTELMQRSGGEDGRYWPRYMLSIAEIPELSWPAQDILFQCGQQVYRYDTAGMTFAPLPVPIRTTGPLQRNSTGVLIQGVNDTGSLPAWQAVNWQGNAGEIVYSRTLNPDFSYQAAVPPDGGYLFLRLVNEQAAPDQPIFGYKPLTGCTHSCTINPMENWTVRGNIAWLRNGPRLISEGSSASGSPAVEGWLTMRAGGLVRNLGMGRQPFWFGAAQYGFIAANQNGDDAIIIGEYDQTGTQRVLVTAPQLVEMMGGTAVPPPEELFIDSVIPHPQRSDRLFVVAADHTWDDRFILNKYLLLIDSSRKIVLRHYYLEKGNFNGISPRNFSEDGQWLVFTGFDNDLMSTILYILDLQSGVVRMIDPPNFSAAGTSFDFSANTDWLVLSTEWGVELIALHAPFRQRLQHNLSFCEGAAWIDRE